MTASVQAAHVLDIPAVAPSHPGGLHDPVLAARIVNAIASRSEEAMMERIHGRLPVALYAPIVFALLSLQRWIERRQIAAEADA